MNELKLSFLGPARVEINGRPIEIQRRRGTALLAYLAVMGEPQPRDTLAALFWPESDHARGHKALRRDLSELNLALESQWLDVDRESVGLRAGTWVDVAHFQQQLAIYANHPSAGHTALIQAASLYRGDFLSGFTLADSPPFDEWQFFQSEQLRREFASALKQLVDILSEQGEDDSALAYARRWLSLDPLHEAAHRRLMQLYVQSDQRAAALRQYESCRQLLADELDVLPAPETTALYHQIRERKIVAADAKTRRSDVEAAPRHNLPTQTTAFIGREQELADIQRLLLNTPECRLLALVGPGGIGKTRLALAAAAQALDSFANGVFFVSLASLNEVAYIVPAIAEALHFNFYGTTDSKEQLLAYLSKRRLLLVLDNFEHLLEGVNLLAEILDRAADVALLVTSRERLKLREEWSYDLQGLAFPAKTNQNSSQSSDRRAETLTTYSAVQLFLQRARQAEASFVPSPEDVGDIVWICQLVEGMPLGLELAAPWIRSLSCHDIAVEIERSLDFLTATLRNMPERHRSLRAVFGQTWQRLSMAEQGVLRQLSVFRGGCTREAAKEVTQATLGVLSSLVDKALVRRMNTGRYELHELVRQNAAERLVDGGEFEAIRHQHAEYYLALSEAAEPALLGPHREVSLARLEVELDNVRAALAWTQVDVGRREAGLRLVAALAWFWLFGNHVNEARGWFAAALQRNSAAGGRAGESPRPGTTAALAKAHWGAGMMALVESDYPAALTHLEESVNIARQILDRPLLAIALRELGYLRLYQGDLAAAHRDCEESVTLGREVSGQWALALALHNLGHVANRLGDHVQARAVFEECRSLFQVVQDPWGVANSLLGLGLVASSAGDYAVARAQLEAARTLWQGQADKWSLTIVLNALGEVMQRQGELDAATEVYVQCLMMNRDVGDKTISAMVLHHLGTVAQIRGRYHDAVRLYAVAAVLHGATEGMNPHTLSNPADYERDIHTVRVRIGDESFSALWAEGQTLTAAQAMKLALTGHTQDAHDTSFPAIGAGNEGKNEPPDIPAKTEFSPPPQSSPSSPPAAPANLSTREVDVLRLLVQGLTYTQIADQLVISPRTVNHHLTSIYTKLDVTSRHAATRFALDHHLV